MEDSNAMTIEFLRARLLAERSVSRSARQRAEELAKRVKELEEQLKFVTLQRQKAEKATADVLAILENEGISDFSDEFDLGSDEEMPNESGTGNHSLKGEERSMHSNGRRHDSNELSGSDLDSSPVVSRSLSWKGRNNSPNSFENYKNYNVRGRSSFSSAGSAKYRRGKSCRQIRCRETRSVVDESGDDPIKVNGYKNEAVHTSEGVPNCSESGSDILRAESLMQEKGKSEMKLANDNYNVDAYGGDRDMEKALEQQAQLIGRYEEMEKAQREWEEKFRENNNSTPDSCDPGNYSDITEEREDSKAQTPPSARAVTTEQVQEVKSEAGCASVSQEFVKAETRENMPKSHDTSSHGNQNSPIVSSAGLTAQNNSDSMLMGNKTQENSQMYHPQPFGRRHHGSHSLGSNDFKPNSSFTTDENDGMAQKNASSSSRNNKHDLYALVPHDPQELSGVLDSLRQAKLSLQQELNRLPLVDNGYSSKAIGTLASSSKLEERLDIPIGCAGLFRLPTDFSDEAPPRSTAIESAFHLSSNFYPSRSTAMELASPLSSNFYHDKEILRTSVNQLGSAPYFVSSPSPYYRGSSSLGFSPDRDRSLTVHSLESGSRYETRKSPFDPFMDAGLMASSSNNRYPAYTTYPSHQNLTPQMPFSDGLSRPYLNRSAGNPSAPADQFPLYDEHARQNMYR